MSPAKTRTMSDLPGVSRRRGRRQVQRILVRCRSCGERGFTSTAIIGGRKRVIDRCGVCKRDGVGMIADEVAKPEPLIARADPTPPPEPEPDIARADPPSTIAPKDPVPSKAKRPQINFRMEWPLHDRLREAAARSGLTIRAVANEAIRRHLDELGV